MPAGRQPDAIDLRFVFRAYTWLAIAAGIGAYAFGDLFMSTYDLPAVPWGRISIIRIAGAVAVAFGCCAVGFGSIPDDLARRRGLLRFAIAHLLFGVLLFGQWSAIWQGVLPPPVGWMPLFIGVTLLYIAATSGSTRASVVSTLTDAQSGRQRTLHDRPGALATIRSRYEEQIAEAARQEERARLARDLHDAVKQQLFVIQTAAATAEARWHSDTAGAREAVDRIRTSAREAIAEMEAMLEQLQAAPIGHAGLAAGIRHQAEALAFRTGARVSVDIGDLPPESALPPGTAPALFRISQEALSNIGRHARPATARAQLARQGAELVLAIEDDGAGFETEQALRGLGLRGMRERAAEIGARFALTSGPGTGTVIRVTVPCDRLGGRRFWWRALLWLGVGVVASVAFAGLSPGRGGWAPLVVVVATVEVIRNLVAAFRMRTKMVGRT